MDKTSVDKLTPEQKAALAQVEASLKSNQASPATENRMKSMTISIVIFFIMLMFALLLIIGLVGN